MHQAAQAAEPVSRQAAQPLAGYPRIETVTAPVVGTAAAAFYFRRSQQTMRHWASTEKGPIRPVRTTSRGPLSWRVVDICNALGVKSAAEAEAVALGEGVGGHGLRVVK